MLFLTILKIKKRNICWLIGTKEKLLEQNQNNNSYKIDTLPGIPNILENRSSELILGNRSIQRDMEFIYPFLCSSSSST